MTKQPKNFKICAARAIVRLIVRLIVRFIVRMIVRMTKRHLIGVWVQFLRQVSNICTHTNSYVCAMLCAHK